MQSSPRWYPCTASIALGGLERGLIRTTSGPVLGRVKPACSAAGYGGRRRTSGKPHEESGFSRRWPGVRRDPVDAEVAQLHVAGRGAKTESAARVGRVIQEIEDQPAVPVILNAIPERHELHRLPYVRLQ